MNTETVNLTRAHIKEKVKMSSDAVRNALKVGNDGYPKPDSGTSVNQSSRR